MLPMYLYSSAVSAAIKQNLSIHCTPIKAYLDLMMISRDLTKTWHITGSVMGYAMPPSAWRWWRPRAGARWPPKMKGKVEDKFFSARIEIHLAITLMQKLIPELFEWELKYVMNIKLTREKSKTHFKCGYINSGRLNLPRFRTVS